MFDKIKSALKSDGTDDKISPADVAQDVSGMHDAMDEMKLWSTETVEWLQDQQEELSNGGEDELVGELDDLISYTQSVFFRVQYGDHAIETATEESEKGGDE